MNDEKKGATKDVLYPEEVKMITILRILKNQTPRELITPCIYPGNQNDEFYLMERKAA